MGLDGAQIKKSRTSPSKTSRSTTSNNPNLIECKVCQQHISKNANTCPYCGEPIGGNAVQDKSSAIDPGKDKIIAIAGCFILAIGVFSPVVKGPIVGSMNYFGNGEGDGVFILALAAVSALCVFIDRMQYLWITSIFCLGMLGYSFYQFKSRLNAIAEKMQSDLSGGPLAGLTDFVTNSANIQWGFAVLVFGAILVLTSAMMSQK